MSALSAEVCQLAAALTCDVVCGELRRREGGMELAPKTEERLWLLLVYKVPRNPTALRATVWRRLKRLGALLVHDAIWVLPATPWTREQWQWLVVEITELGGNVLVWESRLLMNGQEETLVERFVAQVDTSYRELLAALDHDEADLVALSRKYQQTRAQDYFHSALGEQVRDRLLAARGGLSV